MHPDPAHPDNDDELLAEQRAFYDADAIAFDDWLTALEDRPT